MSSRKVIIKVVLSSMFLALALVLPFVTGQIARIGNMLCPMHIPVLLCGFIVGPFYGMIIGFIAPLLRFVLFSMPKIIPTGISMSFELATYGFVAGTLFRTLKRNKTNIYVSLIIAMLSGRIVWGIVRYILMGLNKAEFSISLFISGAFTTAIPGIILQIILIPIIVNMFKKYID